MYEDQDIKPCPVNYSVWVEYINYLKEENFDVLPGIVTNAGYPEGCFGVSIKWWECYEYEYLDVESHFAKWLTCNRGMDFDFVYQLPKAWYHDLFKLRRDRLEEMLVELTETQDRFVNDKDMVNNRIVEW